MNERIMELAEQTKVFMEGSDDLDIFIEKFAELLIRECISLVEPTEEHRRDASWGFLGGDEGVELLDEIVDGMKKRYGVES